MAEPITLTIPKSSQSVLLEYSKGVPASGAFFDNTKITAVSAQVLKPDGTTLTPTNAITFTYRTMSGGYKGWVADWNPGNDINVLNGCLIVLTPTRSGVAAALTMPKVYRVQVSDVPGKVWDEVLTGATHNVPTSAGKRLRQINAFSQVEGTVQAAPVPTATVFKTDLGTTHSYHHLMLAFTSGSLAGEAAPILDYDAATQTVTVEDGSFFQAPVAGDTFAVIGMHVHPKQSIADTVNTTLDPRFDSLDAAVANVDSDLAAHEAARASMQSALQAEHDATQTQLASHESSSASRHTDELAEHDATQAAIALIAGAAEGYLYGPSRMSIPASGTKVYVLRALIRDLDTRPTALVDPDNQRVTLSVKDSQTGLAPIGVTLSDSNGGVAGAQMTWLAAGDFETQVTLDTTALEDRSLIFETTWAKGGITNKAILVCVTSDENAQLARIEAAVANVDGDLAAHEAARASMQTTLSDQLTQLQSDVNLLVASVGTFDDATLQARLEQLKQYIQAMQGGANA